MSSYVIAAAEALAAASADLTGIGEAIKGAAAAAAPSTVVVPGHDRTLRPEWMRAAARERLGTEPVEIPGGHCPHVSRPDAIAELLVGLT